MHSGPGLAHPIRVRHFLYLAMAGAALFVPFRSDAQTAQDHAAASGPVTVEQKWQFFVQETFTPLTIAASAATGGESQATNTDPKYGVGSLAMAKRFGAATVDNVTQDFFSDLVDGVRVTRRHQVPAEGRAARLPVARGICHQ